MIPYLIIDGYNLMHAAGIARRRYGPGDLERCRSRLHRELAMRLTGDVLAAAVIVYDAFESVSNDDRAQEQHGIRVLFAAQGQDADSLIERLLQQHSVPKRVLVVSSDHRLHKAAKRRKARSVDSDEFWFDLDIDIDVDLPASDPVQTPVVSEPNRPTPGDDVQADLQQWAQELSGGHQSEHDSKQSGGEFDADYLKRLSDDLNQGRLR